MNTLHICSHFDIVHSSDIMTSSSYEWKLSPTAKVFTSSETSKIILQINYENTKHGRICNKTLTITTYNSDIIDHLNNNLNCYVIRVLTTSGWLIIGSKKYPSTLTIEDNFQSKTLIFTVKEPLL